MGTNYYIERVETVLATGEDRTVEVEHIGKYSGGWTFTFQGCNQKTVEEWRGRVFNLQAGERIRDEYHVVYNPEEFWTDTVEASLKPWARGIPARTAHAFNRFDSGSQNWHDGRHGFSNCEFC